MDFADDDLSWLSDDTDYESPVGLPSPAIHARKEVKRRFVNGLKREALNQLVPELPPPDTDLYVIGNGAGAEIKHGINPLAFDFGTFIPHVISMLGDSLCALYVSTWTMNRNHVKSILELFDNHQLRAVTVIADPYFKRREAAIANELITGLQARSQRFLAFKNHVKCICLANADNTRFCTITGSANLSAQPRCEQYVLTTDPAVYQFFVTDFFEAMIAHAQNKEAL